MGKNRKKKRAQDREAVVAAVTAVGSETRGLHHTALSANDETEGVSLDEQPALSSQGHRYPTRSKLPQAERDDTEVEEYLEDIETYKVDSGDGVGLPGFASGEPLAAHVKPLEGRPNPKKGLIYRWKPPHIRPKPKGWNFQSLPLEPRPGTKIKSTYHFLPAQSKKMEDVDDGASMSEHCPPVNVPHASASYLGQSSREPERSSTPRPLLIVMDLNGTIVHRTGRHRIVTVHRAGLQPFLKHMMQKYTVMIWSSAQAESVKKMCDSIMSHPVQAGLVAIWSRDKFGLTSAQFSQKVQVYKRLETVWEDQTVQSSHPDFHTGGRWDQTNTVLVDDSALKAVCQPHNLVKVPEFVGQDEYKSFPLKQIQIYLEKARWYTDISTYLRKFPFQVLDRWVNERATLTGAFNYRSILTKPPPPPPSAAAASTKPS